MEESEKVYVYQCNDGQLKHTKVFKNGLTAVGQLLVDYNKRVDELKLWCIEHSKNIDRYNCVVLNDHAFIQDLDNIDKNVGYAFTLYEATIKQLPIE